MMKTPALFAAALALAISGCDAEPDTPVDGDTIFALSTGALQSDVSLLRVGALAADVTADAIVRAVRAATSIPGYPASRDLEESTR